MQAVTHSDTLARFGYALSAATRTEILLTLRDGPGYPSLGLVLAVDRACC